MSKKYLDTLRKSWDQIKSKTPPFPRTSIFSSQTIIPLQKKIEQSLKSMKENHSSNVTQGFNFLKHNIQKIQVPDVSHLKSKAEGIVGDMKKNIDESSEKMKKNVDEIKIKTIHIAEEAAKQAYITAFKRASQHLNRLKWKFVIILIVGLFAYGAGTQLPKEIRQYLQQSSAKSKEEK